MDLYKSIGAEANRQLQAEENLENFQDPLARFDNVNINNLDISVSDFKVSSSEMTANIALFKTTKIDSPQIIE